MTGAWIWIVGYGCGCATTAIVIAIIQRELRRGLPPATRKQLRRADRERAYRIELRDFDDFAEEPTR